MSDGKRSSRPLWKTPACLSETEVTEFHSAAHGFGWHDDLIVEGCSSCAGKPQQTPDGHGGN